MDYYHVRITRKSEITHDLLQLDLSEKGLIERVVNPFMRGEKFFCDNTIVDPFDIESIRINRTVVSSSTLIPLIHERREEEARRSRIRVAISDRWYVTEEGEEVTWEYIKSPPGTNSGSAKKEKGEPRSMKVFIVHGHDEVSKLELARLLENLGLEPIILHEQANKGRTIIEKFEANASDVEYAFVLLTPDDLGGPKDGEQKPRARQNVILELGFFMGKLGRDRVCYLYKGGVEIPSDISGVAHYSFKEHVKECLDGIITELKASGYKIRL